MNTDILTIEAHFEWTNNLCDCFSCIDCNSRLKRYKFVLDETRMVMFLCTYELWWTLSHQSIVLLYYVLYIRSMNELRLDNAAIGSDSIWSNPIWKESMAGYYGFRFLKTVHFLAIEMLFISFNGLNANKECNASQSFARYFVLHAN